MCAMEEIMKTDIPTAEPNNFGWTAEIVYTYREYIAFIIAPLAVIMLSSLKWFQITICAMLNWDTVPHISSDRE